MCEGLWPLRAYAALFFRYAMAAEWRPYAPRRGYVLGLWPLRAYAALFLRYALYRLGLC